MSKPESLLPYYRWKPTKELLKACKKACAEYNEKHSSTASSSQRNKITNHLKSNFMKTLSRLVGDAHRNGSDY